MWESQKEYALKKITFKNDVSERARTVQKSNFAETDWFSNNIILIVIKLYRIGTKKKGSYKNVYLTNWLSVINIFNLK